MKKNQCSLLQSVRKSRKTATFILVMSLFLVMIMAAACSTAKVSQADRVQNQAITVASDLSRIKILGLNISPYTANAGQPVTISVDILNEATIDNNYQAELVINNTKESSQLVTIPAGNIQTINYKVTKNIAGDYRVSFGNLSTTFSIGGVAGQTVNDSSQTIATTTGTSTNIAAPASSCCSPDSTSSPAATGSAGCCGTTTTTSTQQSKPATGAWGVSPGGSCCSK